MQPEQAQARLAVVMRCFVHTCTQGCPVGRTSALRWITAGPIRAQQRRSLLRRAMSHSLQSPCPTPLDS